MISSNFIKGMLDTIRGSVNYNSFPKSKVNNIGNKLGLANLNDVELIKIIREIENHQCRFIQLQMKNNIDKIKVPSIGNFVNVEIERSKWTPIKDQSNG